MSGIVVRISDLLKRAEGPTRTYQFQDGEHTAPHVEMNTEIIAKRIEKANANLMVSLEVLREAENHVVHCQGDVEKDRMILERAQDELRNAIEARNLL